MFDIWNTRNLTALSEYDKENFRIFKNDKEKRKICVIYCSSNNIWYPNEKESFIDSIINKNRYEWMNYRLKGVQKEIFIRDIYKSWYVIGINKRLNSIDNIIEWLKEETEGYEVISIGSSAGGYMASLIASKLNALYSICFSAQFNLNYKNVIGTNPFLQKYLTEYTKSNYYNISDFINKSSTNIYYLMPSRCEQDALQMEQVSELSNVYIMRIKSKRHGIPILKCNLEKLLNMSEGSLKELFITNKNKEVNPIIFSIRFSGIKVTVAFIIKEIKKMVIKFFKSLI